MITVKSCFWQIITLSISLVLLWVWPTQAKPMPLPNDEGAVNSDWIVVARYIGHAVPNDDPRARGSKEGHILGVQADFAIEQVLKPSSDESVNLLSLKKPIHLFYSFFEDGWCILPAGVVFRESLMPPKGSEWILFLNHGNLFRHFCTYGGNYGCWPASKENIAKAKKLLSASLHY